MPKVLVVGAGGREHAIVRALLRTSVEALDVHAAPGNPGIAADAQVHDVAADDVPGLVALAQGLAADLVVVGPEVPLVAGLVDALRAERIPAFGPTAAAARLEGSKAFAKEIMIAAGVPTAGYETVTTVDAGMAAVAGYPVVLKYDGLAAGKGVVIAEDEETARATLVDMLEDQQFGDAAVVVEEFLGGEEVSLLAICDGERAVPLAPAQDYKRIFEGDRGPNTGGMGSYSPVVGVGPERVAEISAAVHQPVVDELARRGIPFTGVLYAGLMVDAETGTVKVLEYNTRFGDPETQAVLPRLQSDLYALASAAAGGPDAEPGGLDGVELAWDPRWAVTLVLASRGYPASAHKGDVIKGLDATPSSAEVTHAGTALDEQGRVVTAGGRVLNVTALGESPSAARQSAYATAQGVIFDGRQLRRDIAERAVERYEG
ncbi:phosphoribosylamine--glycine ligase [Patulibacter sp. NPDC049589]|uniref:phosphoribosylamine--glycine ligase n=1 Tax=Patulibacter sp. NPDC049589 TaxID=3154731 RepID=UPI00344A110A